MFDSFIYCFNIVSSFDIYFSDSVRLNKLMFYSAFEVLAREVCDTYDF